VAELVELERMQVAGGSQMGKSSLEKALLRDRGVKRVLIFDPTDEYEQSAAWCARSASELHQLLSSIPDEYEEWSVRYVPAIPDDVDDPDDIYRAEAAEAGRLARWSMSIGDNVLMVDEAHDSCGQFVHPWMVRHVKRGAHHGCYAWICSQRPADVHPKLRGELKAHEAWYLRLAEANDLEVLAARRGREFAERVMNLPKLHALRVVPGQQELEEWEIRWNAPKPHGTRQELIRVS
jgi:hypothetical protein